LEYGKWELQIPANADGSCPIAHLSEVKVIIKNKLLISKIIFSVGTFHVRSAQLKPHPAPICMKNVAFLGIMAVCMHVTF